LIYWTNLQPPNRNAQTIHPLRRSWSRDADIQAGDRG
jgi:hypothetical protein